MRSENTPEHIAIIMDGTGRWARSQGLERSCGHERGVAAAEATYRACQERGVPHLTLYAFSYANWSRPQEEVDMLMRLCAAFARDNREEFKARGIEMRVIGDLEELPTTTRREIEATVLATKLDPSKRRMTLTLALGYGGRNDLVGAVRALVARAHAGMMIPEDIDESMIRSFMTTSSLTDPDLVIRTGGEKRLSDFLLFESAMSELFFSDVMWPEFDEAILDEAIMAYGRRQRRFGRTPEQIAAGA